MNKEQENNEESHIQINVNKENNFIQINKPTKQLTYVILSTQPGRKINYPPFNEEGHLRFQFKRSEGISEESEGYCAMGFSAKTLKLMQSVQKKSSTILAQKILYISKISLIVRYNDINTLGKSSIPDIKYNFSTLVMPPQDLTAQQIQQLLQKIVTEYGPVEKVDVKRNCLIVSFEQNISIKYNFSIKNLMQNQKGNIAITYWAITNHRTLYTYQPCQILQLPVSTQIKEFAIHSEWLIIAMSTEVLFLHLYRPTQHFLSLPDLNVQTISAINNQKIILFQYKFMHIYQLFTHKNPILIAKAKTKKIQPHTVAFKKKTALFGGINYSNMMNEPVKQKQIYVVENFTTANFVNKNFLPDKTLYICKKTEDAPIKNLKYLAQTDLFICSCAESVYLFHLQSSSMIASVDLTSPIMKLYEIDYPINMVNCMVKIKNDKKLIRISFQQYGQIVGAEVTSLDKYGQTIDFYAHKKQIFTTDGALILLYESSDKNRVLYNCDEQKQKILAVTSHGESFAFLLKKQSILQAYFMEL